MNKYDKIILRGGDKMKWYGTLLTMMAIFGIFLIISGLYLSSIVLDLIGLYLVVESLVLWIIKR